MVIYRRMMLLVFAVFLLCGCGSQQITIYRPIGGIDQPRVISLDAPEVPWVNEIENRLREKGFKVLYSPSTKQVSHVRGDIIESFDSAESRYIVHIRGDEQAPCFAGGHKFNFITVSVIDTETNERVLRVSDAGHSEGCAPLSSNMFRDVTDAVANLWL